MTLNFSDWACSLSGCDGGNPQADVWLCGIEWGFDTRKADPIEYYSLELPREIQDGFTPHDAFNWQDSLTYTYGRNFAKLYTSINGGRVEE